MSSSAHRPLPAAGCLLTTAYCPLPAAGCSVPAAYCPLPTACSRQRGISLIEVLFAMGILSVGILGMAALLPLGVYELSEADKLDQSSTLGRAAFRDLEVRGYLQPKMWVDTQVGMLVEPTISPDPDTTGAYNLLPPTAGSRLVTYPYLPVGAIQYFSPLQTAGNPGYGVRFIPQSATQGQLFPLPFDPLAIAPITPATPIGVSMMKMYNPASNYPPYNLPSPFNTATYFTLPPTFPPFAATESPIVVLDPLMVGEMGQRYLSGLPTGTATVPLPGAPPAQWTSIQTFPYQSTYVPGAPVIPRLTLLPGSLPPFIPSGSGPAAAPQPPIWPALWIEGTWTNPRFMPFAAADRIFRAADDLAFNPLDPTDRTRDRPTRSMNYDSGVGMPLPPQVQFQGSYSWFVTIAPSLGESDSTAADTGIDPVLRPDITALTGARQFTASVVVCQNRVLDVPSSPAADFRPSEWMVPAKITGGGIGGGEVTLYASGANTTLANEAAWLAGLKPGTWLMLSGITVSAEIRQDPINLGNYYYWPKFKAIANWYRIVAVDDGSALNNPSVSIYPVRSVTLAGTDWPQGTQWDDTPVTGNPTPVQFAQLSATPGVNYGVQFANLNMLTSPPAAPVYIYAYATIVEGVVGVYQKTISFDGDSLFSSH